MREKLATFALGISLFSGCSPSGPVGSAITEVQAYRGESQGRFVEITQRTSTFSKGKTNWSKFYLGCTLTLAGGGNGLETIYGMSDVPNGEFKEIYRNGEKIGVGSDERIRLGNLLEKAVDDVNNKERQVCRTVRTNYF